MYGYRALMRDDYLSSREYAAVSDFHALTESYTPPNADSNDQRAILADPAWLEVVAAARTARESVLTLITDPDEIAALTIPSPLAALAEGEKAKS